MSTLSPRDAADNAEEGFEDSLKGALAHGVESPPHESGVGESAPLYGAVFWACYAANTATMIAVSSMFRYADFVQLRGGNEFELGLIVGLGAVGSLSSRFLQAFQLDRIGPRRMWLGALACFITSLLLHTTISTVDGWLVYAARILMMFGLAGAFGASLTFVSQTAPPGRMGELLGMLGTSGFLGLAIGPSVSDAILGSSPDASDINRMFFFAAGMSVFSWVMAFGATSRRTPPLAHRSPTWSCIREHHPGSLLVVAAAMGLGLSLPGVFVRSYARDMDPNGGGIGMFFLVYASVAFGVRVATRRMSDRLGTRPVVLAGLGFLACSMLCYLIATTAWLLIIPAVLTAFAHALLFPAVVSGGNYSFPPQWRGLATTLTLTMFDIGNLLGQPLAGGTIHLAEQWGLPGYSVMFVLIAVLLSAANAIFFWMPPRLSRSY